MNLYMLRHGQTPASRENVFSGSIDPPLTDVGLAMAEAFAHAYAHIAWNAFYCSPMLRTRQTLAPLAQLTGIEPMLEDGLRELHYGEWEGMKQDEVKARWPDAFAYWAADPASRGTPGGETAFHVAARAMTVIEAIRSRHRDGNILIVSHKATLRIIACALLGIDVRRYRDRIAQPVAAVSLYEMKVTGPLVHFTNDRAHLSPELRNAEGT